MRREVAVTTNETGRTDPRPGAVDPDGELAPEGDVFEAEIEVQRYRSYFDRLLAA